MATDAAAAEKAKEKMLTLRSSDHQEFELKESVAMQSVTLKNMIEGGCADNCIPLPKVTSHILAKVIEYCNKHAQPTGAGDAAGATAEDELKIFDADFVKVEQDTLFDLILAANYLDIKGLLDLTCQTVTDMIKGKAPKEIRKTSNIENDFTVPSKPASAAAISSSERKQMDDRFNAYLAHSRKNAKKRLTVFAEHGETSRKHGYLPVQPPLEIFKYPELLERAWGWDMILPYSRAKPWSVYRNYLQEYYKRNAPSALAHQMEANAASDLNLNGDDGNGLAALFNLCINMEGQLLYLLKSRAQEFDVDEVSLNDKLTNCAHQITNVDCGGFPALTVALKCIMAEADLLCKLLMCETRITSDVIICRGIRKCAFRFMTYKGPECFAAAATMMATTKEAKLMSELLRNNHSYSRSYFIRNCTLGAMFRIFKECSAVEESTGNCSDKELVNKDNLLESDEINQNTKICSKEELPKGNHLEERNEAKHGSGEMNETEQKTKGSLKENVVEQGNLEVMAKDQGFDEIGTSPSLDNKKEQEKKHTRVSGKADGNAAKSAEVPSLSNK